MRTIASIQVLQNQRHFLRFGIFNHLFPAIKAVLFGCFVVHSGNPHSCECDNTGRFKFDGDVDRLPQLLKTLVMIFRMHWPGTEAVTTDEGYF